MAATPTVIFVIAGVDASQFSKRITTTFPSATPSRHLPWSLSHSFYRSAPTLSTPSTGSNNYLHLLRLSAQPSRTLLCISSDTAVAETIAIPNGGATSDFTRLIRDKFGSLWQPLKQGELHVANGVSCDVGMFHIQFGDLLRDRGVTTGGIEIRGTIIIMSLIVNDEPTVDVSEQEKALLREFCQDLGLLDSQQNGKVLAESWGDCGRWNDEAALWCNILRELIVGGGVTRSRGSEA